MTAFDFFLPIVLALPVIGGLVYLRMTDRKIRKRHSGHPAE